MTDDNETKTSSGFTAPYVSWGSFSNLLDRMTEEGLPMRIDRSYLSNMAGSTQTHLLKALKELDLIDKNAHPTEALKGIISAGMDDRPGLLAESLRSHYAEAIRLPSGATQSMLEELFLEKYNVTGSTRRKSIAFFLAAAKYAGIPVSQHFKTPKRVSSNGVTKRKAKAKGKPGEEPPSPALPSPTLDDPKKAYVDLLLKKASEDMDSDLLDRIERVIGLDPQPSQTSQIPQGGDDDS